MGNSRTRKWVWRWKAEDLFFCWIVAKAGATSRPPRHNGSGDGTIRNVVLRFVKWKLVFAFLSSFTITSWPVTGSNLGTCYINKTVRNITKPRTDFFRFLWNFISLILKLWESGSVCKGGGGLNLLSPGAQLGLRLHWLSEYHIFLHHHSLVEKMVFA
jgi:hypothetical protein